MAQIEKTKWRASSLKKDCASLGHFSYQLTEEML